MVSHMGTQKLSNAEQMVSYMGVSEAFRDTGVETSVQYSNQQTNDARTTSTRNKKPKDVVLLDEHGEPSVDPEEEAATTLDPWTASGRAPWENTVKWDPI